MNSFHLQHAISCFEEIPVSVQQFLLIYGINDDK